MPIERWLAIETRTYTDKIWRALDRSVEPVVLEENTLGIWIGDKVYFSSKTTHASGADAYQVFLGARERAA